MLVADVVDEAALVLVVPLARGAEVLVPGLPVDVAEVALEGLEVLVVGAAE